MDLTEAEDIRRDGKNTDVLHSLLQKRWQELTEELYKEDIHNPDNYNGVLTHLEPNMLECKVKWALGSITMNKASGVMEFQLSNFKS